ncbi:MAG: helix-turn-helix domain-containing protein [Planctomycetales bacterium]|jgi:DNA-binding protein Fis
MKRVIVQILPTNDPSTGRRANVADEVFGPELLPINGGVVSPNDPGRDEDAGVRVEAIVSAERARAVVDTVLNVNELASVDSFDQMVDLLIQRELANDDSGQIFHRVMSCVEKALIEKAFVECGQIQTRTANRLGVNRNTIHKKLLKHDLLDPEDDEVGASQDGQFAERKVV